MCRGATLAASPCSSQSSRSRCCSRRWPRAPPSPRRRRARRPTPLAREALAAWEAGQEEAASTSWDARVAKLTLRPLLKLEVEVSELHVRVQPDTAADALAAGVVLRSLRIADMPPLT